MTDQTPMDAEHDSIYEAAADWLVRLQDSSATMEDTLAWQRWMGADPRHEQAFARIEALGQQLLAVPGDDPAICRAERTTSAHSFGADYDGSVPLSDWRVASRHRSARRWAIAASVLIVVGASTWVFLNRESLPWSGPTLQVVQTAVGENRAVALADGSTVTLGGGTELRVTLHPKVRHIELTRGEAFFAVAKDSTRPFTVEAGKTMVTAVGTAFNVRRTEDRVQVAVVEGRVVVEPTPVALPIRWFSDDNVKRKPVRVSAGEKTTAGTGEIESAIALSDPGSATGWQSGHLAFEREPLRYVIDDVNRYTTKPIVVDDASIGELSFTGTVRDDNIHGWIASLETAFGVKAVEQTDRIVLIRAE